MNIVFIGPPGSGKGTIARRLADEHGFTQLSTGDILRQEIQKATLLGKKVQAVIESGNLVSDDLINQLMRTYATKDAVYDGYPRTIAQAEALSSFASVGIVILFTAPERVILGRLTGRRVCPRDNKTYHTQNMPPKKPGICDNDGVKLIRRKDDLPASVKKRFHEYQEKTAPLIAYYRKKKLLTSIDASVSPEAVYTNVMKALNLGRE